MKDKLFDLFGVVSTDEFNEFRRKTESKLDFNRKTENVSRDFSWVPIVEETLPYIDNIVRNPKKFLQQEEDIVIVEKSKKISTETIKHLSQHTNFIQDVDEHGLIKPSKVLNVEKDDSWDLYENRFIFTLIKELGKFVRTYTDRDLEKPHTDTTNVLQYVGKSSYSNEDINITLNIDTFKTVVPENFDMEAMHNKIVNIQNIVGDFENSLFMKSLSQAIPVKSPIRKTNIILKDTNFQRALALWEYIKNSEIGEPEDRSVQDENLSNEIVKKKFDLTYFLEYLSMIEKASEEEVSPRMLAEKILALMDEYIDLTEVTEKKMNDFLKAEVKSAIKKRTNKDRDIYRIYERFTKNHDAYLKGICELM